MDTTGVESNCGNWMAFPAGQEHLSAHMPSWPEFQIKGDRQIFLTSKCEKVDVVQEANKRRAWKICQKE